MRLAHSHVHEPAVLIISQMFKRSDVYAENRTSDGNETKMYSAWGLIQYKDDNLPV